MEKTLLENAFLELGTKEIKGSEHNKDIIEYADICGQTWVKTDEIPWCGFFVGAMCIKSGIEIPNKSGLAKAYLGIGETIDITKAEPNDLVIFDRKGGGHVAICLGFSHCNNYIFVIGGNQGNSVSVAKFSVRYIVGVRRVSKMEQIRVPNKDLKRGDRGQEVKNLQKILNQIGFNCGVADGIFGGQTKNALIRLQTKHGLEITGKYNKFSYLLIQSLLTT